jgi:hypothetical protein
MKNQYVGDIGDFGKYGFLKKFCHGLKLGVIWYLTLDEKGRDGKIIQYLNLDSEEYKSGAREKNERMFQQCDPKLYDTLRKIVAGNKRDVKEIARRRVLPNATYYDSIVLTGAERQAWFAKAIDVVRDCDLVFLDPDNGLAEEGKTFEKRKSAKHVMLSEVRKLFKRGHSLIIYHHLNRSTAGIEQLRFWRKELRGVVGKDVGIITLWYHRGTARLYFIIPQKKHKKILDAAVREFLQTSWGEKLGHLRTPHFSRIQQE